MKLGYACINLSLNEKFRTCRLATYEVKGINHLKIIAIHNLSLIIKILEWNIKNNIFMYRLSSELIPFASKSEIAWKWWDEPEIIEITYKINNLVNQNNLRLSMHPGQYTILNSKNAEITQNSIDDLEYHGKLMDLCGASDMIIHVGGVYGDKKEAINRFIERYSSLNENTKDKIRIENDDKSYTLEDCIFIRERTGIPICFDIHHHICNPSNKTIELLLPQVITSWEDFEKPKMHISTGKTEKTDRRHADFIDIRDFNYLLDLLKGTDIDLMVEAKAKNLAVLKLQKLIQNPLF